MIKKEFGKIASVSFGQCGYQNQQIGLSITLRGEDWGTCTSTKHVPWNPSSITPSDTSEWTEKGRTEQLANMVREVSELLSEAKVDHVSELKDIPVECEFDGQQLKDWRILTEVL